jgi:hypothetical protein
MLIKVTHHRQMAIYIARREPAQGARLRANHFANLKKVLTHSDGTLWTSVSHTQQVTAYAASVQSPIGIDLCEGPVDPVILDLCHPAERSLLPASLIKFWATKEAVLKLLGCGIVDGLEWPRLDGLDFDKACVLPAWRLGPLVLKTQSLSLAISIKGYALPSNLWLATACLGRPISQ